MQRIRPMFRIRIYRVQAQLPLAGIHKLMLRPRRHNHQISSLHILVYSVDGGATGAGCEGECLVDGVHFVANVATDGDRHEDYLGVEACEEDFAEDGGGAGEGGGHGGEVDH